jgi:hypothetical protein
MVADEEMAGVKNLIGGSCSLGVICQEPLKKERRC